MAGRACPHGLPPRQGGLWQTGAGSAADRDLLRHRAPRSLADDGFRPRLAEDGEKARPRPRALDLRGRDADDDRGRPRVDGSPCGVAVGGRGWPPSPPRARLHAVTVGTARREFRRVLAMSVRCATAVIGALAATLAVVPAQEPGLTPDQQRRALEIEAASKPPAVFAKATLVPGLPGLAATASG